MRTSNPNLAYVMAAGPEGFYQAVVNPSDPASMKPDLRSIDIVIGSGCQGQTYRHWEGDRLFELPMSYWTYDLGTTIQGHCIECHMPVQDSNSVTTANSGQQLHATMRAHRIAIYPNATLDTSGPLHRIPVKK